MKSISIHLLGNFADMAEGQFQCLVMLSFEFLNTHNNIRNRYSNNMQKGNTY